MKKRRGSKDSLDLLLDTICNAFGGLIFIALLVAVMAQVNHQDEATTRVNEMKERKQRLELQHRTIEQLTDRKEDLVSEAIAISDAERQQHKQTLNEVVELDARLAFLRKKNLERANEVAVGVSDLTRDVEFQIDSEKDVQERLEISLAGLANELDKLDEERVALQSDLDDLQELRIRNVDLPREGAVSLGTMYIVRYGRIYPVHEDFLSWLTITPVGSEASLTEPIATLGWKLPEDRDAILTHLRNSESGATVWVYTDSFHVCAEFHRCVADAGVAWAWEPITTGEPFIVGSAGYSPSRQ